MSNPQMFRLGLIVLLLGVPACARSPESAASLTGIRFMGSITDIKELQTQNLRESTIYLRGKTIALVPLLGQQVYELQDGTGKVWVITQDPPPAVGDEVVIKGVVRYKPISLNGRDWGSIYVEQLEQVEHTPANMRNS